MDFEELVMEYVGDGYTFEEAEEMATNDIAAYCDMVYDEKMGK